MSENYTLMTKALRLVNDFRNRVGRKTLKKLPKGEMSNAKACPLYNAIDASCTAIDSDDAIFSNAKDAIQAATAWGTRVRIGGGLDKGKYIVTCPKVFDEFIDRFDSGEIPSLIKE